MSTQRKVSTSLNDDRQRKLDEIVAGEPLGCPSSILAVSLDILYALWQSAGRDLKGAIGALGRPGSPNGAAA